MNNNAVSISVRVTSSSLSMIDKLAEGAGVSRNRAVSYLLTQGCKAVMARLDNPKTKRAKPIMSKCERPPAGWTCSRPKDHTGPCATMLARPESSDERRLRRILCSQWETNPCMDDGEARGQTLDWLRCPVGDIEVRINEITAERHKVALAPSRKNWVYIAGPMTGYADLNFPAFNAAAETLRADGYHVINPADHGVIEGAEWGDYLRADILLVAKCESIYLLPGWEKSKGANLEMIIAMALEMQLIFAEGAQQSIALTIERQSEVEALIAASNAVRAYDNVEKDMSELGDLARDNPYNAWLHNYGGKP